MRKTILKTDFINQLLEKKKISDKTKLDIGWSDHTTKSLVVYKAVQKWKASYVEMHIDLDGQGFEYKSGHCWLPKKAKE